MILFNIIQVMKWRRHLSIMVPPFRDAMKLHRCSAF